MALYGPISLFGLAATWLILTGFGYTLLAFAEAGFGLVLLAMLISYMPSMYQSFQRREAAVAALDVRADTPPTATAMLIRVSRIGG